MLRARIRSLFRGLVFRSRLEEEVRTEWQFHIQERADELARREGLSHGEATRRARLEFGGQEKYREAGREARGLRLFDELSSDVKFACRTFGKSPGFAAVAVLSLATGIGLATSVFSVADSILLRPLPYPEPEHLISFTAQLVQGERPSAVSGATFEFWRDNQQAFSALAAVNFRGANLASPEGGRRIDAIRVTPDFFRVIGVQAVLGRGFVEGEDDPGAPPVTVISHDVWQQFFSGDPELLGQQIAMNDIFYTVVGILPEEFVYFGAGPLSVYEPLVFEADPLYGGLNYTALARLRPGVSLETARGDMARVFNVYSEANPGMFSDSVIGIGLIPLQDAYNDNAGAGTLLLVLLGAVTFVLLIACANVANLLVSRTSSRQREIATRLAIGAGSGRILRQLLTESLMLSVFAGIAGILMARWGIALLVGLSPTFGVMAPSASVSLRVLGFTLAVSVATGLLFGISGVIYTRQIDAQSALRASGNTGRSQTRTRLSNVLVVSEVGLALTLLIGAALLGMTFYRLNSIPLGFDDGDLFAAQVSFASERYATARSVDTFEQEVRDRLTLLPGVVSVATASGAPLVRTLNHVATLEGESEPRLIEYRSVSPEYFETLGIPVLFGRGFASTDTENSPAVALVSDSFVAQFPDGTRLVSQHLTLGRGFQQQEEPREIIGVVRNVADRPPGEPLRPTVYVLRSQASDGFNELGNEIFDSAILVRTAGNAVFAETLRQTIAQMDPQMPVTAIRSIGAIASDATRQERFNMFLMSVFAGVAFSLTMVALYGVLSYQVVQRTQEIGVRSALGATRREVIALVLGRGMRLASYGVAIGLAASVGFTRFLSGLLFGVAPVNIPIYATVAAALIVVAFAASYVPARRATKIDPLTALRYE